jgi:hypothetical protein
MLVAGGYDWLSAVSDGSGFDGFYFVGAFDGALVVDEDVRFINNFSAAIYSLAICFALICS